MHNVGSRDFVCYPAGEIVFEEGAASHDIYLVKFGLVGIYKTSRLNGERTNLAVLGAGSVFGEMAAATGRLRSATAIALSDCSLIKLSGSDIQEKLRRADPIVKEIVDTLITHLVNANSLIVGSVDGKARSTSKATKHGEERGRN
jgi:CRP/FNR family transcriptional regulator, cyclic AMP receptor protein